VGDKGRKNKNGNGDFNFNMLNGWAKKPLRAGGKNTKKKKRSHCGDGQANATQAGLGGGSQKWLYEGQWGQYSLVMHKGKNKGTGSLRGLRRKEREGEVEKSHCLHKMGKAEQELCLLKEIWNSCGDVGAGTWVKCNEVSVKEKK